MNKNNAPQPLYNAQGKPAGRIRQKNEETILAAAAEEFARYGFKGTSMNAIASRAGLPKANVHYYFNSKLGLYVEVMRHILELWDTAFDDLTVDDDRGAADALGSNCVVSRLADVDEGGVACELRLAKQGSDSIVVHSS